MSKVIVDTLENTAGTFTSGIDSLGPSTDFTGVGSYTWGRPNNGSISYQQGTTASGMHSFGFFRDNNPRHNGNGYNFQAVSGTWRSMSGCGTYAGDGYGGLWVRIS